MTPMYVEEGQMQQRLGQYEVGRKLGEGGMGEVYLAKHLSLGRTVALKLLSPALAAHDPACVKRFKREARAAAILEHPNIVTVYTAGEEDGRHFIEMEFVQGQSLQDYLKQSGPMGVAEAARVLIEVVNALEYAHARHIVHRDIKPSNVMLRKDGAVKLMDFGLARDVTADSRLTLSGAVIGTPHYMSPEQTEGMQADARFSPDP